MKKNKFFTFIIPVIIVFATGCKRPCCESEDIMVETYMHKYGVEVPADDWALRGENGKVISTLSSGVKVTRGYVNGLLDGETTHTFPHSDTIEKIESYANGVLIKEVLNNTLGNPVCEIQHLDRTHQRTTVWYDNGSPQSEEERELDRLVNGSYYSRSHQLESRVEDGEGIRTQRDYYGQLISVDTIINGKMALETIFYSNGSPKAKIPYKDGLIEGQLQTYLPSGEPQSLETWSAGKQEGITLIFRNGEKYAEVPYHDGEKDGIEKHFRDGSIVVEEVSWSHGQKNGPASVYIENTTKTDWFFKDKLVTKATYDQMTQMPR